MAMNNTALWDAEFAWLFAYGPENWGSILGQVLPKTKKMVFEAALHYKVQIEDKMKLSSESSSAFPYTFSSLLTLVTNLLLTKFTSMVWRMASKSSFRHTWSCLIVKVFATQEKFLEPSGYCIGIICVFTLGATNVFGCFSVWTYKTQVLGLDCCMFICAAFKLYMKWNRHNMSVH